MMTLTMVIGPAVGGLLISALGVAWAYAADAISCVAVVLAVLAVAPQPPYHVPSHESLGRSITEGLQFVRSNEALMGSFAMDLVAMTFGLPRALFAVLSVSVYHAGAGGTGALYSALAAGATVAAMTTEWLKYTRRLGRVVIVAVVVWGIAIALAALATTLWLAAILFAGAGAADSISAVCRTTINQMVTPERMRGGCRPSTHWWSPAGRVSATSSPEPSPARWGRVSPCSRAEYCAWPARSRSSLGSRP